MSANGRFPIVNGHLIHQMFYNQIVKIKTTRILIFVIFV